MAEQTLTIYDIPNDILSYIMEYVPQSRPICAQVCKTWHRLTVAYTEQEATAFVKMSMVEQFKAREKYIDRYYIRLADYFDAHGFICADVESASQLHKKNDGMLPPVFKFCRYNICNEVAKLGHIKLTSWLLENKIGLCLEFDGLVNVVMTQKKVGPEALPLCWFLENKKYLYRTLNPMFVMNLHCSEVTSLMFPEVTESISKGDDTLAAIAASGTLGAYAAILSTIDASSPTGVTDKFHKICDAARVVDDWAEVFHASCSLLVLNASRSGRKSQIDFVKNLIVTTDKEETARRNLPESFFKNKINISYVNEERTDWIIENGYLGNLSVPRSRSLIDKYAAKINDIFGNYFPPPEECEKVAGIIDACNKTSFVVLDRLVNKCCKLECSHTVKYGKPPLSCQYSLVLYKLYGIEAQSCPSNSMSTDVLARIAYLAVDCGNFVLAKKVKATLDARNMGHTIMDCIESAIIQNWWPGRCLTADGLINCPSDCTDPDLLSLITRFKENSPWDDDFRKRVMCGLDTSDITFIHFLPKFDGKYSELLEQLLRNQGTCWHHSLRKLFRKIKALVDRGARLTTDVFTELGLPIFEANNWIIIDYIESLGCIDQQVV
jgi:hypothetical protein